jgi:hypothetical protein
MNIHERLLAAAHAESAARRDQASSLLSGVALIMLFALIIVAMALYDTRGLEWTLP